jgi:hypothetical protein
MKIMILKADGAVFHEDWPSVIYARLKMEVGGRIEYVRVWDGEKYITMVVNETGLLDGLPRNQAATDLYLANSRRRDPAYSPEGIYIAGNTVVIPIAIEQLQVVK